MQSASLLERLGDGLHEAQQAVYPVFRVERRSVYHERPGVTGRPGTKSANAEPKLPATKLKIHRGHPPPEGQVGGTDWPAGWQEVSVRHSSAVNR